MSLRRLLLRLSNVFFGRRADARLSEEIAAHLSAQTEDNIRAGMTPAAARRHARLQFGSVETIRESYHREEGLPVVESLLHDLRYALRVLRKSPAFTAVAIVTLMLGIGANVVVFGVLNAVLLRPLPVRDPQNLYQLRHRQWASFRLLTHSYAAFEDLRRRNTTFSGMAAINAYSNGRLTWGNAVAEVHGDEVTGNYFDLLGVGPAAGQFFHENEEHGPSSAPFIVLSDTLWRSAFNADHAVIGATVALNKQLFTIVGVASPQFHGTERFVWPDYWIPLDDEQQADGSDILHDRKDRAVTVIGRLRPGVTPQQATENLDAITAELAREYPQTDEDLPLRLIHPGLYGDEGDVIRGFLISVTVLALLVLAAACANLASLFAARAADRSRELALRIALGSSRRRVARQLLTEALVLAVMGGAAGLVTAFILLGAVNRWQSPYGRLAVSVDGRVYLAGFVLTLASALLSGLLPARQAWRSSPLDAMKGAQTNALHLRRFALRDLLLGAQIAICTLLVTASLVAARGMQRTLHAPLGFQPQGAMLASIDLSNRGAGQTATQVLERTIEAAQNIPGVTAAGAVNRVPMTGGIRGEPIFAPGTTDFRLINAVLSSYTYSLSPGYLNAAGTRLLSGRDVSWRDTPGSPRVALVNQTFARKMWGAAQPIGRRFILDGNLIEVAGIVADSKYHDLAESPQPAAFLAFAQSGDTESVLVVRSHLTPLQVTAALQHALSSIAPDLSVAVTGWPASLDSALFPARTATVALGVMGVLAAMLSVTGIFGMAAWSVSRRMRELGIRVALGARRQQIVTAAVGRPLVLLAAGSAAGLVAGILASHLLGHIVYQANARDPLVILGAVVTMALLGIIASAIPARRALAVDPSRLMREE